MTKKTANESAVFPTIIKGVKPLNEQSDVFIRAEKFYETPSHCPMADEIQ